jgi:DNA-binding CsgD family transcriptional regulator
VEQDRAGAGADVGETRPLLLGRSDECNALERLLDDADHGRTRVLILRGEAGIGKSALLGHLSDRLEGWSVARAVGVESELELAYSGLHQVCGSMLDQLDRLPDPQRDALAIVFGLSAGPAPNPFLVGLATLTLLAEVAEQRPLACIVDDAQWLDQASEKILAFVARRLLAERIAIVCATRAGVGDDMFAGLPELLIDRLGDDDARTLLLDNVHGPLDEAVCEQVLLESRGNALAVLELARSSNHSDLAGGYGLPGSGPVAGKIEKSYERQLRVLSSETQLLVLAAAAEPLGDPALLHRAGQLFGIEMTQLAPAVDAGLITVGARVEFAHPLVRAAAYRTATADDRRRVHHALAEGTDPETDPDRRAWHRANSTAGPDEQVASELERSAARAQARGGVAAAAAFLRRAVEHTDDSTLRAERALAAAQASFQAGAFEPALAAVATAEAGELDAFRRAQAGLLRGHLAVVSSYGKDAAPLLLQAARRLEPFDLGLARRAYLTAYGAAVTAGYLGGADVLVDICRAVRALPPLAEPPHPLELLLDALAVLVTEGRAAATPSLQRAAKAVAEMPVEDVMRWGWIAPAASAATWDFDRYGAIFERQAQLVRAGGALAELPQHLNGLAWYRSFAGDLAGARLIVAEIDSVAAATGTPIPPFADLRLRSLQGREAETSPMIEATVMQAAAAGQGVAEMTAHWAAAVLYNGLARYDEAASAASRVAADALDPFMANFALPELIEAAARRGDTEAAEDAFERLTEATRPARTDWARGSEARSRALLAAGDDAEESYREAIETFSRTQLRPDLARSHLVYGEWLRREGRRIDAREQLRNAHGLFDAIGMEAFGQRARRELAATGEKVRAKRPETRDELTPQEEQIARLASDGSSNPEIAGLLFISPKTVEYHLHKVFTKLSINSRMRLREALADAQAPTAV